MHWGTIEVTDWKDAVDKLAHSFSNVVSEKDEMHRALMANREEFYRKEMIKKDEEIARLEHENAQMSRAVDDMSAAIRCLEAAVQEGTRALEGKRPRVACERCERCNGTENVHTHQVCEYTSMENEDVCDGCWEKCSK